jgi:formylglycine-generating enzyme required for sulfatase activity
MMKRCLLPAVALLLCIPAARAQVAERPSPYDLLGKSHAKPLVTIETVPVRNPHNSKDKETGYGAVAHEFAMGKFDVTVAQYAAFLNAKADVPPNKVIEELWCIEMSGVNKRNKPEKPGPLITRTGSGTAADPYKYEVAVSAEWGKRSGDRPICWVTWFDAARFANWINNGATKSADTEKGAYTLPNYMAEGIVKKNPTAHWWIPSEDEWYKAAYYDPMMPSGGGYHLYPTRSNDVPHMTNPPGPANSANFNNFNSKRGNVLTPGGAYVLSPSAYETFDQGGNVWQWTDGVYHSNRIVRGGSYSYGITPLRKTIRRDYQPGFYEDDDTGFRLATKKAH